MECIGIAWVRFLVLIHSTLDLSLSDSMLLQLFCLGLDIKATLYLDMIIEGSFAHKPMIEQRKILDHILAKHTSSIIETKTF